MMDLIQRQKNLRQLSYLFFEWKDYTLRVSSLRQQKLYHVRLKKIRSIFGWLKEYVKYEKEKDHISINTFRLGVSTYNVFNILKYHLQYSKQQAIVNRNYIRRKYFLKWKKHLQLIQRELLNNTKLQQLRILKQNKQKYLHLQALKT